MLNKDDIIMLLSSDNRDIESELFDKAREKKQELCGRDVYLRGLIEISNTCRKDCYYCGIRKSNKNVDRYVMEKDEVINSAKWGFENGFSSLVLQSGERIDKNYITFIEDILKEIAQFSNNGIRVTISFGEQDKDTYKRWFEAGAHRYLLRVESSNKELYNYLHPEDHNYDKRIECLHMIRETGYQLGTGIMIGLPNQTYAHLADDIQFFKDLDIDMLGMGPYLPHEDAPLPDGTYHLPNDPDGLFNLSLRMIAVTRLCMPDINIASTTALQAIKPFGREKGILAGANVFMPNISEGEYRPNYKLYDNKPCTDDSNEDCLDCVGKRMEIIGEDVKFGEWGDSKHFVARTSKN